MLQGKIFMQIKVELFHLFYLSLFIAIYVDKDNLKNLYADVRAN